MLRVEARNSQTPIERKPPWIKTRLRTGPEYTELKKLVQREGLHTVCQEAGCPNIFECWEDREATFLIGGDQCTRRCDFCQIATGRPLPVDTGEPARVAESVATMGLRYATVTGVARDDLPDGGAWLYAQTAREIHRAVPGCGVELLIPDFNADPAQLAEVFSAAPEVLAHNIETVPRIFRRIRPGFRYERSLDVLRAARAAGLVTKSNLILGMGEERDEVAGRHGGPARGGLRPADHHPVPAPVAQASPGGAVGAAGGIRRARRAGQRAGFRRRDVRAAGPVLLPGGTAVPPGDGEPVPPSILTSMAKKSADAEPGRIKQIRMVAGIIRTSDPRALPLIAAAGLGVLVVCVVIGLIFGLLSFMIPLGILLGVLAAMILFGRFAQSAQFKTIEGQPGAAAAVLQSMRGNWTVTPAIAANRNMDVVHRAVGPPGVVLVGEGSPNGLASLLAAEKKRVSRVAYEVPIFDLQVGDADKQIDIKKLQRTVMKLPRTLKGPAIADLNFRLKALPQQLQMPKGPVPRSARMPRAPRPRTR